MHINQQLPIYTQSKSRFRRLCAKSAALVALAAAITITPCALAGEQVSDGKEITPPVEDILGSRITGLLNLEFSNQYITPRGLNVTNHGVVFQPLLLLFTDLYKPKTPGFLDDVSLVTGVWNDFGSERAGAIKGNWNEIDGIGGLSFKFLKQWQFDTTYTVFRSQTHSYFTNDHMEFKLTYHDDVLGPQFSINPYVNLFVEMNETATVDFDHAKRQESGYFEFGADPTFKPKGIPVTFELPTDVLVVGKHFYQKLNGDGGGAGASVFTTEFKVSTPISCIPKAYGIWTVYAGFQYYHLMNEGQLDGNEYALGTAAPGQAKHNLYQYHGGVSIFF